MSHDESLRRYNEFKNQIQRSSQGKRIKIVDEFKRATDGLCEHVGLELCEHKNEVLLIDGTTPKVCGCGPA